MGMKKGKAVNGYAAIIKATEYLTRQGEAQEEIMRNMRRDVMAFAWKNMAVYLTCFALIGWLTYLWTHP